MGRVPRSTAINVRISEVGIGLLHALQDHYGLSQASIVEMLLREDARRQGINIPGSGADLERKRREKEEEGPSPGASGKPPGKRGGKP